MKHVTMCVQCGTRRAVWQRSKLCAVCHRLAWGIEPAPAPEPARAPALPQPAASPTHSAASVQPASILIPGTIPADTHDDIRTFVALAAAIVNTDLSACEVHIKSSARVAHGLTHDDAYVAHRIRRGYLPRAVSTTSMSGGAYFAYDELRRPGALLTNVRYLRVQPGTRYLVTLKLPRHFEHGVYPHTWLYARYKTAAAITLLNWHEELLHLAVHEFTHVFQYVGHYQRSEIYCEQQAHAAVYRVRSLLDAQSASTTPTIGRAATR